jgi:hypothetical protein
MDPAELLVLNIVATLRSTFGLLFSNKRRHDLIGKLVEAEGSHLYTEALAKEDSYTSSFLFSNCNQYVVSSIQNPAVILSEAKDSIQHPDTKHHE